MNAFRLLRADEIECRISQIKDSGLSLLLYKTARTDANLLDETVGEDRWTNDFKLIDGVLFGGIGIDYGQNFVWKWDAGVESNTEAEKGRASDAFKRAGFKHGIGRELYTAPFIWIPSDKCSITERNGKLVCYDNFSVGEIKYGDNEEIVLLTILKGTTPVFKWTKGSAPQPIPAEKPKKQAEKPSAGFTPTCANCGKEISDKVHDYSVKKYGKPLCMDCQKQV